MLAPPALTHTHTPSGHSHTSHTPRFQVLAPPAGTALIFGGDVTHAGMPVETGLRSVFVASFSTRTDASNPGRCHGLQVGPTSPHPT